MSANVVFSLLQGGLPKEKRQRLLQTLLTHCSPAALDAVLAHADTEGWSSPRLRRQSEEQATNVAARLPSDVLGNVYSFLSGADLLGRAERVNRHWRQTSLGGRGWPAIMGAHSVHHWQVARLNRRLAHCSAMTVNGHGDSAGAWVHVRYLRGLRSLALDDPSAAALRLLRIPYFPLLRKLHIEFRHSPMLLIDLAQLVQLETLSLECSDPSTDEDFSGNLTLGWRLASAIAGLPRLRRLELVSCILGAGVMKYLVPPSSRLAELSLDACRSDTDRRNGLGRGTVQLDTAATCLTSLDLWGVTLTPRSWSQLPALTALDCDCWPGLVKDLAAAQPSSLRLLKLYVDQHDDQTTAALARASGVFPCLAEVHLSAHNTDGLQPSVLSHVACLPALQRLGLSFRRVSNLAALGDCKTLVSLKLQNAELTLAMVDELALRLEQLTDLELVHVQPPSGAGGWNVLTKLAQLQRLRVVVSACDLNLCGAGCGAVAAQRLVRVMKS